MTTMCRIRVELDGIVATEFTGPINASAVGQEFAIGGTHGMPLFDYAAMVCALLPEEIVFIVTKEKLNPCGEVVFSTSVTCSPYNYLACSETGAYYTNCFGEPFLCPTGDNC